MRACLLTLILLALILLFGSLAQASATLRVALWGNDMPLHGDFDGERAGLEADLARALAEELGKQIAFIDPPGTSALQAVARGLADISMNSVPPTEERRRLVDFTAPYLKLKYRLAGKKNLAVSARSQLDGKRVAAPEGPAVEQARRVLARSEIVVVPSLRDAVHMAAESKVHYAFGEDAGLQRFLSGDLVLTGPDLGTSELAIAAAKGTGAVYERALTRLRNKAWLQKLATFWEPGTPKFVHVTAAYLTPETMTGILPEMLMGTSYRGEVPYLETHCGYFDESVEFSFMKNRDGMVELHVMGEQCDKPVFDPIEQILRVDQRTYHLRGKKDTYTVIYPYDWGDENGVYRGLRFIDHCAEFNAWIPHEYQSFIGEEVESDTYCEEVRNQQ